MSGEPSADLAARETAHEQAFVDVVYRQLATSTRNAQALAREGHGRARLGHEGGLVERDAMVFQAARRIANLDAAHEGLVFGRLDLKDPAEAPRYIGRIGLRDDNRDTLLIDWRAPAAAVFYQATASEPQGIVRRRVLRCAGRTVTGVEDDLLDAEAGADLPVVGEGALMAQLARARDRSMHSIVATIQAEQDKAIRAPAKGVVEISGGPGTGKTVVALHRAAFLLYTDRARYERGGVLVVGPSGVFMRYIERVLPSLGETAVALRALGEVVDGLGADRHDVPAVAAVKGAARMVELLRRTARQAVPDAPEDFRHFYRDDTLVLTSRDLARIRRGLLGQGLRNAQTRRVPAALVEALWRQVRGERALERGRESFVEEILADDSFLDFVRSWWPPLEAPEVLGWLREDGFARRVGEGVLEPGDLEVLSGAWGVDLSIEDVALVDELRYLIGDPPEEVADVDDPLAHLVDANLPELGSLGERRREGSGEQEYAGPRTTRRTEDDSYAHVLVDEAQDLSPMQWRMLGRRGETATWTVVGDLAQSSWPDAGEAHAAREVALFGEPLRGRQRWSVRSARPRHSFHLATNYRNSAEIYEHAAAYAERVGLAADLPTAVRRTGVPPEGRILAGADLRGAVHDAVRELLDQVEGTVGVVAALDRVGEVRRWLTDAEDLVAATRGEDARLVALTGLDTKGLEFDAIVVVAPDEIEGESPTGAATLYVVLTRATQRLVTLTP